MSSNTIGKLPEFDEYTAFAVARDRIDVFIKCNNIPAERHVYVLLSALTERVYKRLSDVLHPVLPNELTYAAVIEWLSETYGPKKVFGDRQAFHRAKQMVGESASDWYERIEKLAEPCRFGYVVNHFVRDRFICGLRSPAIFDRLNDELEPEIPVEKALRIAMEMELESVTKKLEL